MAQPQGSNAGKSVIIKHVTRNDFIEGVALVGASDGAMKFTVLCFSRNVLFHRKFDGLLSR